jgi:phosphatidate cytidylyltransferase
LASNLAARLTTAAVAAPLLLLLLFRGAAEWWFLLVLLAACLGGYELFWMTHREDRVAQAFGVGLTAATSCTVYFCDHNPRALLTLVLLLPLAGLMLTLWRLGDVSTALVRAMAAIAAPGYVGALLTCLALLRRDQGPFLVFLALKLSWLADTGGYALGRWLGRYSGQLHARVSPKKTKIGFVGSLLGALLGATVAHFWYLPRVPLLELLAVALVCGALGQLGDLAESMIKRAAGVKDSGAVIPGHGGLLDRVDALLVVSPLLYLYTLWSPWFH